METTCKCTLLLVKRPRISYNERMYQCRYVYSNRRTVAIRVITSETVEVRAPRNLPRGEVRAFVERSDGWIEKQIADRRRSENAASRFRYSRLLWNGEEIDVLRTDVTRAAMTDGGLTIPASCEPRLAIARYLRLRAKEILPKLCEDAAAAFGYPSVPVLPTSAATQWGNCDGTRIRLHDTLLCLPPRLRDYVILHELTHLEHLDHSPAFWRDLTARMPDAKARRAELKRFGWLLRLYRKETD